MPCGFHRHIFFAAHGFGPYECFFCRERTVSMERVLVHHINEDRTCDHPYNLAPAHKACHNRWHNHLRRGVPRTIEMQKHLRTVNLGRKHTPEHRASRSWKGRKHTAETRAKMSVAARKRWERERA